METLKLRKISIDTYRENVAYLHRDCPVYRSEGFQALSKIEIYKADDGAPVIAVLNVVDDENILAPNELGLSEQAFKQLNLPDGTGVRVEHARPPVSLKAVHRKISDLRRLERVLKTMVAECSRGDVPDCPIIDALYAEVIKVVGSSPQADDL